tara:strand:- start:816 stop:1868 length:1053 start_codon:yes stop_codon:yes gene_type:complete
MTFPTIKKISNWEYWPSFMFYVPLLPYAFYLAIKARSFGFFSAVNSGIEGSGNGLESKYKTTLLIPSVYKPKTIFIPKNESLAKINDDLRSEEISFPLIIKPDIGFRGLLVKKINSKQELIKYLEKYASLNLIVQEFIEYKNECGVFYYKIPGEKNGVITSITLKKYLTVLGDGKSTLLSLINGNKRAKNYIDLILELNKANLNSIPPKNEEIILNVIGNHSKGTEFINGNHLINNELEKLLNKINLNIEGWNYGRIDIKYNRFEELLEEKNFKILEINGVISEPTHIYDSSKGSYFGALKSIKNHWKIIYKIGIKNNEINHVEFTNLRYLINVYFRYKKYLKEVTNLTN